MKKPLDEKELTAQAKALFDDSVERIDAATLSSNSAFAWTSRSLSSIGFFIASVLPVLPAAYAPPGNNVS